VAAVLSYHAIFREGEERPLVIALFRHAQDGNPFGYYYMFPSCKEGVTALSSSCKYDNCFLRCTVMQNVGHIGYCTVLHCENGRAISYCSVLSYRAF
jgi:hypothetical protein